MTRAAKQGHWVQNAPRHILNRSFLSAGKNIYHIVFCNGSLTVFIRVESFMAIAIKQKPFTITDTFVMALRIIILEALISWRIAVSHYNAVKIGTNKCFVL